MQNKTFGTVMMSLVIALAAMPTAAASPADCTGDPCAAAKCSVGEASAHAVGSEHAWADASAGGWSGGADGPGTAHAEAYGSGDVSASAKGKKDWSLKEANADCEGTSAAALFAVLDGVALPSTIRLNGNPGLDGLSVQCLADDAIVASESFLGRLYVDGLGDLHVFDAERGDGFAVPSLAIELDGATLGAAVPMTVAGMTPLDVFVGLETVDGGEEGENTCRATLYA